MVIIGQHQEVMASIIVMIGILIMQQGFGPSKKQRMVICFAMKLKMILEFLFIKRVIYIITVVIPMSI